MFDLLRCLCFPYFLTRILSLARGSHAYDPEASITGLYTGPYFDPLAPRNLTAHLGDRAELPCTVRQLGDKSVSWVRMRDADILTVDRYTFVGDERFEAHYSIPAETWNLIINYVQERDAGDYECQVSTEPKMSQFFNLRVVVPQVNIEPPGDRHVKAGSQVRIDCHITDVVQIPDYIFWYHDNLRVLDRTDGNLDVMVTRTGEESIMSSLHIERVRKEQSGNYTCMPSNLHAAFTLLHVLNEEHPAAMQDGRNSASLILVETELIFFAAFIFFFFFIDFTGTFWSDQHSESSIEIMSGNNLDSTTSDKMHNVKITNTTTSNTDVNNLFILIINSMKNNVSRDVIKQIIINKCLGYCDKENKGIPGDKFVSFQHLSRNVHVTQILSGCFDGFDFGAVIQHDYDNQRFFEIDSLALNLFPRSHSFYVINLQKIIWEDCIHALHKLTSNLLSTIEAGFTGQRCFSINEATQFEVTPVRLQTR